jgi:hypothetical protein
MMDICRHGRGNSRKVQAGNEPGDNPPAAVHILFHAITFPLISYVLCWWKRFEIEGAGNISMKENAVLK